MMEWLTISAALASMLVLWLLWRGWQQMHPELTIPINALVHASRSAHWLCNERLTIIEANSSASQLFTPPSPTLPVYFGHAAVELATDELQQLVSSGEWQGQVWLGEQARIPCLARVTPLSSGYWLVALEPNAAQLALQQQQQANLLSPHSGLPNSQVFEFGLRHFTAQYQQHCQSFALLLLELPELSNLQQILTNDELRQLWRELIASIRPELPIGSLLTERQPNQLGLFVPLKQTGAAAWQELEHCCAEWLSFARGPYLLGSVEVSPQLRVGAAVYPDAGREPDELLNHTAQALWQARQSPQQCVLWQQTLAATEQNLELEALENALLQYQCEVRYQAIHTLETNMIASMNAQIVWHHPQRGLLQFQQFANAVEQNGLQITFERWLLEQVCLSLSQQPLNQQHKAIMLQISAAHLLHGQLLNRLQQLVVQYRLSPSLLTLCITEQGWLLDPALFAKQCQQLVRAGFLLALQDFGQGQCALKILSAVSWHHVIISGRLIDPIEHSDTARNHLACLIRLINARQLPVTAADVTQELQAYLLHVMGCRDAYGEFWGPAQTAAQWRQVTEIAETA